MLLTGQKIQRRIKLRWQATSFSCQAHLINSCQQTQRIIHLPLFLHQGQHNSTYDTDVHSRGMTPAAKSYFLACRASPRRLVKSQLRSNREAPAVLQAEQGRATAAELGRAGSWSSLDWGQHYPLGGGEGKGAQESCAGRKTRLSRGKGWKEVADWNRKDMDVLRNNWWE